jgi:glutaredoxin
MDIEQLWEKAQEKTEVIRGRVKALSTFGSTQVPYIFLGESAVNEGHTVVRQGKVIIEKPMILLPEDLPQFEGFDFEQDLDMEQGTVQMFLLMRGIRFPSLKYNNTVEKLDLEDLSLAKSVEKYKKELEREENVNTALVLGPEDCWQLSILLYMASLVGRCARNDIISLMEKFREK